MAIDHVLAQAHPRTFEPLLPSEPDAVGTAPLRSPPKQSYWQRMTGGSLVEHNETALALDLQPIGQANGRATFRRKRIIICADGTWNTPTTKKGEDASTNVWRLFELVKDRGEDGTPQLKYYHAGVGTTGSKLRRVIDGASGRGLSANMQDCYEFLIKHYHDGDAVYLFGFSRGAYTTRTLAGLIRNSGIVDVEKPKSRQRSRAELLDEAYAIYRGRTPDTLPVASRSVQFRADYAHPDFNIACIGVWDTVGALGIPVETPVTSPIRQVNQMVAGFHDVTLSAYVDCAFHALALNERREAFKPTLWVQQPHAAAAGQILEQVWFPGAHSDIGGGYGASERGIANVTLRWMVNRVADTCSLEFDPRPLVQREGDRCGFVVHDSMGWVYKAGNAVGLMKPFRRIVDGGLCDGGVRDADRVITEALHGSAERFAIDARASGPFDPMNVHDYIARRAKENGQPEPPPLHRDRRRAEMKEADVDEVTLQRRDEMGRVISTLTLHRNGKARYVGLDPAPRRGTFIGSVPPADFTEVARRIVGTSFFELADRYGSRGIPRKATAVTVRSGRRRKSVLSYEGLGPTRLDDVGRAIETAETHVSWDR